MPASQPSSTNQLKSCMLFQCPPYWGGFLLSRWAILEQSPSRCEGNRLTFWALVVIRHRAAVTDVGGGMWTAAPGHGGPSNKHCRSKKMKHQRQGLFLYAYAKYAEYVLCMICRICNNEHMQNMVSNMSNNMQINMHNMHNMQIARQNAKYAKKYAKNICRKICKNISRICYKIFWGIFFPCFNMPAYWWHNTCKLHVMLDSKVIKTQFRLDSVYTCHMMLYTCQPGISCYPPAIFSIIFFIPLGKFRMLESPRDLILHKLCIKFSINFA